MPKRPGAPMKAASLKNLRKGRGQPDAVLLLQQRPKATAASAADFVKLQAAGLPPLDALCYLHKDYISRLSKTEKQLFLSDWLTNALVAEAWNDFSGGRWPDLEKEDRYQLALDVHSAQCAYFLFTSDFTDPSAPIGKIAEARAVLMKRLELDGGNSDVFAKFLKEVAEKASASGPPIMGDSTSGTDSTGSVAASEPHGAGTAARDRRLH